MPRETTQRCGGSAKQAAVGLRSKESLIGGHNRDVKRGEIQQESMSQTLEKPRQSSQNWTHCQILHQLKTESDFSQSEQA